MDGSGYAKIIMDPDPEGPKTYGSDPDPEHYLNPKNYSNSFKH
jgi:hypothetical protein